MDDDERLWLRVKQAIRDKHEPGSSGEEFVISTTLQKVPNRIRLFEDYFERRSAGSKTCQKVKKDIVIDIANRAMSAGKFSIENPELVPVYGRTGWIVCSVLILLHECDNKPGR